MTEEGMLLLKEEEMALLAGDCIRFITDEIRKNASQQNFGIDSVTVIPKYITNFCKNNGFSKETIDIACRFLFTLQPVLTDNKNIYHLKRYLLPHILAGEI